MSAESEVVFSSNKYNQNRVIPDIENRSPLPNKSINKNLYMEGVLDAGSGIKDPNSSSKKSGRKALAEITNELKARKLEQRNQRYNMDGLNRSFRDLTSSEKKKEITKKELHSFEVLMNEKLDIKHNIEQKFGQMRNKVSVLKNNFEDSVLISKRAEEKYQCILQLAKGCEFVKMSFKKGKLSKRFVFYSDNLNALCWRDPKSKFPKTKQIIYLSEVKGIVSSYSQVKGKKNNASVPNEECFFSIDATSRSFDLIAPSIECKNLWVKTLNLLLLMTKIKMNDPSQPSLIDQREYENVARQFAGNMNDMQDEVEQIKHLCRSNEKNLKKTFLEAAEGYIKKETDHMYGLTKAIKTLEKELEEARYAKDNLEQENMCVKKHLESSQLQQKQLLSQMRNYTDEKNKVVDVIKEFQRKLLNCVEFINLLDFQVKEEKGEHLVSTANISNGAMLSEDFSNLGAFMNQLQVNFDTIMVKTNDMQKKFVNLQDQLKDNSKLHDNDIKSKQSQYNEIYALYNEAIKEKKKLTGDMVTINDQLNNNIKENLKLKKEISNLESQLNEFKQTSTTKDFELQAMIHTAKKLKGDMENRFETLKHEAKNGEIEKLNFLEERYNIQIRRYENKILENEKMINEMNDLIVNYEDQMGEYVTEIDKKQAVIDDITLSRDKLDIMIKEMEKDLKKQRESKSLQIDPIISPHATFTSAEYFSFLHSPVEQQFKPINNNMEILNTGKKIEIAISEREKVHQKQVKELENNMDHQKKEIKRLESENQQYHDRLGSFKDAEHKLKQKITKYQESIKGVMEEGAKIKKNYKQLELHLSHWLNLIYLENMILFFKDHHNSVVDINDELNHAILAFGTMRLKTAFSGVIESNEFLQNILSKVEDTIPNITFDEQVIELAKYYQHKCRKHENVNFKKSNDSLASYYTSDERYHRRYASYVTDSTEGETTCGTLRRTKGSGHSYREISSREEVHTQNVNYFNPLKNSNVTMPSSSRGMKNSLTFNNEAPHTAKAVKISLNDILKDKKLF